MYTELWEGDMIVLIMDGSIMHTWIRLKRQLGLCLFWRQNRNWMVSKNVLHRCMYVYYIYIHECVWSYFTKQFHELTQCYVFSPYICNIGETTCCSAATEYTSRAALSSIRIELTSCPFEIQVLNWEFPLSCYPYTRFLLPSIHICYVHMIHKALRHGISKRPRNIGDEAWIRECLAGIPHRRQIGI